MSKILVPLIPSHQRYIEMFAGGLSMFFRKKKAKWNVVNDIDNNIVNLYMCVMHDYDELIKNLFWLPKFFNMTGERTDRRMDGWSKISFFNFAETWHTCSSR